MATRLKPAAKLVIILAVVGALVGAWKVSSNLGWLDKFAPKGKQVATEMTREVKKAVDQGAMEKVTAGVNTWGGYVPGLAYNDGLASSASSRFYRDGVAVEFKVIDDFKAMRDAWKAGEIDLLGLATIDSLPTEVADLKEYNPQVVINVDWSRGGDAVVAAQGIKSAADLIGKKVAVATGSPSHTLLMLFLQAGGVRYDEVNVIGTDSGIASAQQFKAGAVDAAVVWAPDDEDCVNAVPGSKVIFNTTKAKYAVADVFVVKGDVLNKKRSAITKFVNGWLTAAAEINSDPVAKSHAAEVMAASFKLDSRDTANRMIDYARLCTYGDNLQFFGLQPGGMKGEEVYNKMHRLFREVRLAPDVIPNWRQIADSSIVSSLRLVGRQHDAEGMERFTAPTEHLKTAPAFASKAVSVTYATGSAALNDEGKIAIKRYFANTAREFSAVRVRIEGNTDPVGGDSINIPLSYSRARSVANFLAAEYGFDTNRFVIVGHGSDNPTRGCESNATEQCRAANRRTEFFLLN